MAPATSFLGHSEGAALLRRSVDKLKQHVTTTFEKDCGKIEDEVKKGDLSAAELNGRLDSAFNNLDQSFIDGSWQLKEEIKSKMPKETNSNDPKAKQAHKEQLADYNQFVQFALTITSRLTEFIKEVFVKIGEFFNDVWNWIRTKFQHIGEKVAEFIKYMKAKFDGLGDYIFGKNPSK